MGTAVPCSDQVDIGEGILLIAVSILESDIDADSVFFTGKSHRIMQGIFIFMQVIHEGP